jgi:HPt (histidine-containing phosphotransfer) domain-containing protein
MLDRLDGDEELLAELVELFQSESPGLLHAIRSAIAGGEAFPLMRAAHTLKGSVGNFCAPAVSEAAFELESIGHAGDMTKAPAALAALETILARFNDELAEFAPHAPATTH